MAIGAPEHDPTAVWADGYCGAVSHLVRTLAALPTVDPSTPQQASRTSSDLLTSVVGGLDQTIAGLNQLGPSPVQAGEVSRRDAVSEFATIRAHADQVRGRIDAASADPAATKSALGEARVSLGELSALDLLKGLKTVPALAAASERAPGCQQLTSGPVPR